MELCMQPEQDIAPQTPLDCASRLTNRDGAPFVDLQACRQAVANDHDLAAIKLARARLDHMNVYRLTPAWPADQLKVLLTQASDILTHFLPAPALGNAVIGNAQPAMAFHDGGDEKVPLAGHTPQAFGATPAVQQDRRLRASDWLERANEGLHQHDLAVEWHLFDFAPAFLTVEMGSQGGRAIQQYVESLHQTVSGDTLVMGRRDAPDPSQARDQARSARQEQPECGLPTILAFLDKI